MRHCKKLGSFLSTGNEENGEKCRSGHNCQLCFWLITMGLIYLLAITNVYSLETFFLLIHKEKT